MFGLKIYSMMSTAGFGGMSKAWIMSWIGMLFIVVLIMLGKKWLGEEEAAGYPFNWLGSCFGVVTYFFAVSFTGSPKIALIVGLVGYAVGGFGLAQIWEVPEY